MNVTIGGVNGPSHKPVTPAPWKIIATALEDSPAEATIGITTGAMTAFAPASVPSEPVSKVEEAIVPIIALVGVLIPILFITTETIFGQPLFSQQFFRDHRRPL